MSAIPGLGIDRTAQSSELIDSNKLVNVDVPGKAEWRFEVPFRTILKLKVLEGTAEIFGTELPLNVELQLTGVKYSLYAPLEGGCKVEYQVIPNKFNLSTNEDSEIVEYISEETSMNQYINLHMVLEGLRIQASDHNLMNSNDTRTGPRVLILGNHQSGKTSLAKILSSYALKMGGSPILVNLNPQDGVFALPGSISATPISDSLDIESVNGWGGSTTSGTTLRNPKQPLIKSYGFTDYKENEDLYNYQVSRMGVAVSSRIEEDITIKNSGIIVDTPPLSIKEFDIIENIISDFEINVAVVLGNERLSIELKKRLKHRVSSGQLNILKVSKSEGVTEVDDAFLRKSQEETIKEYFNGNFRNPLSPFKTDVDLQDAIIYNGVHSVEFNASLSFLPSGDSFTPGDESSDGVKKEDSLDKYYSRVEEPSSSNLDNTIVAITQIPVTNKSEKDLLNTCVLGYAHISNVDDTRKRMKVLLPFPGAFPRNVLFATSVRYTE